MSVPQSNVASEDEQASCLEDEAAPPTEMIGKSAWGTQD